jgi:hypothetical protein
VRKNFFLLIRIMTCTPHTLDIHIRDHIIVSSEVQRAWEGYICQSAFLYLETIEEVSIAFRPNGGCLTRKDVMKI